jgi:hypothetical protein
VPRKKSQQMKGMGTYNDNDPRGGRATSEEIHRSQLRLVEAGLRAEASKEDIKTVIHMLGTTNEDGFITSLAYPIPGGRR